MPSTLRITGLATGLDVDNMVKQLMQAEKTKVDKVKQQRQLIQWRQDLYREIIGDLNTFKSTFFDVLNKDKYILSANSLAPYSVSIDSNAPIKVTATADAQAGQYEVAVSQLAKGATVVGELNAENLNLDTKLSSLGLSGITKIDLTYNGTGTSIEVNGDMSIRDLINEVNSETNGAVKVRFSELTKI
ncbi:flagellar cap protein FliD N-terminal domain-containing protein [Caloramator sp. Dgby_cultured_2]|uniref:flagellar cap protein FliD N-terminal domain-containing protein n=1 Tax=Caloramator sp. Dgby_cultured_2 TaxID=3029174 RepID=UPI00237E6E50|nr:flagellar cap protein FliD N-terminal domain-containing protein [Caloramator sp. Dgby_cultured_2]WDU83948.1 flagellar cap protein FliD N-terminal domain-containing protein [Caloramator sp. Dgby_cultured_2]